MSPIRKTGRPHTPHSGGLARDVTDLLDQLETTTDPAEREELCNRIIVLAIPIADRLAGRYRRPGTSMEDLQQVARAALVQATRRFKGGGEQAFLGYVVPSVLGELKRYFRDCSWVIRPPRRIQEAHLAVRQAHEELRAEWGREPTADELAEAADVAVETVHDVQVAAVRCWPESLDRPQGDDDGGAVFGDKLSAIDRDLEQAEARLMVEPALQRLKPREREVIYLRYYQDRTQREVGQRIGVTQMQISRIESQAMATLRQGMGPDDNAAA
ncbi:MAG TPA: sigma-70 family RNA polymerase sigma factor [Aeromicrobium sp.]|nr:sigma-70 family RNA polymerase sigma factor [Aeromicrobium sp.]HKY58770.1 sigma-70 family RNA polymerase sigma factor [Aeromicrobium sp.]